MDAVAHLPLPLDRGRLRLLSRWRVLPSIGSVRLWSVCMADPRAATAAERPAPARSSSESERARCCCPPTKSDFRIASSGRAGHLLDEGQYCVRFAPCTHPPTAGRIRRAPRSTRPSGYQKPELLATAPNQLWSWTSPSCVVRLSGLLLSLVIIDVFSATLTGWMIAYREGAELAKQFIEEAIGKHQVPAGQLTIHATAAGHEVKPVAFLMADLGVTKSHSRPYVSDDNPYRKASSEP